MMRPLDGRRAKQVAKTIAAAIGAFTLLLAMSGCASIPRRAWENGAAMSRSDAYRATMHGERGFRTMRSLYGSMDPVWSRYQARPYRPFGRW